MTSGAGSGKPPREPTIWIVPVGAEPADVGRLRRAALRRGVAVEEIPTEQLREALGARRPTVAVVHGGMLSTAMLDAQRWLAEFDVTTVVLVDGLTDYYEETLLDRGAQGALPATTAPPLVMEALEELVEELRSTSSRPVQDLGTDALELVIDVGGRTAQGRGHPLTLTRSEFELLLCLARRPHAVVSREELAWSAGTNGSGSSALDSHVSRLRSKLRSVGASAMLETVRGVGYRLSPAGDARVVVHEVETTSIPGPEGATATAPDQGIPQNGPA